jgi:putative Mg2+ transporter-C (MgtC) family protein
MTFRLIIAMLVGAVIGLERQQKNKPAGLRTHILVSIGAALFVIVPLEIYPNNQNLSDVSRVIQGITAGVGFLGAGEIFRSQSNAVRYTRQIQQSEIEKIQAEKVHGLTSAAAIWVSAALGVASGCGLWQLSLIGAFFVWFVLRLVKNIEQYLK